VNERTIAEGKLAKVKHQPKVVAGTSHWIQMDKPEEFNRIRVRYKNKVKALKRWR
jgi:pimeloyl-ACP methyl ester carboxylesterase